MPADKIGRQSSKDAGEAAERAAEKFLRARDMVCVERNYRCRLGEIDLIMQDGAALVFVEVRMRKNGGFGGAAASIGRAKQRRIIAAAQHYLSGLRTLPACRFDAVLLNDLNASGIEWIRDAFGT
ncbi:MAG TPA: YraN family protein [Usitatibacteraceae bacterium]